MTPSTTPSAAREACPRGRVAFVGIGPGDVGLLTLRGRDLIARADVVVLDEHTCATDLLAFAGPQVEVVDASHGEHGAQLTDASRVRIVAKAAKALRPGQLLVRLVDGDPTIFAGVSDEAQAVSSAGVPFELVPGVSAVAAVPAYAGVPVTDRSIQAVHVVHAGIDRRGAHDWGGALDPAVTVVVLGAPERLARDLAGLLAAGRDGATPVALTERGTTPQQRTVVTTLGEAPTLLGRKDAVRPSLAVVGAVVGHREQLSWFESKALFGWRVLVPRTKDQAGATVARLAEHGATAQVVPTISVEPPRTPQQLERAVKGLVTGRYEWVGFTSVNAVRAIREKLEEFGLDARAFSGLKIAAVGGASAAALREWGIVADLVPSGEQSAAGLLADWPPFDEVLDPINRVFLPRADIATDTLVAGLQEIGWEVDDVTAYRTVRAAPPAPEIREAIKSGAFDAVVFTSSSTVRNLVGIAGKPHPTTVVACIGPATAKTAEEHGLRVDVLAPTTSSDALVDALAAHGAGLARSAQAAGEPVRRPSERTGSGRRRAR